MSDIEKLKLFDGRIVQERPRFSVDVGALSLTNAPFKAISATSSQATFNIQVPSLNVFVSRDIDWTMGVNMSMDVALSAVPPIAEAGNPVVIFGKDCALCAYPLQSLCSTLTATINDTTTTINTSDVLQEVVRLIDMPSNRLSKTTPNMLDNYGFYNDAVGAINNPIGSYYDATTPDNVPNGAFWNIQFTDAAGNPLTTATPSYNDGTNVVNVVNGVPVLTDDGGGVNCFQNYRVFFRYTATEKLVLSPFIFNNDCGNEVGLFGVQNIQFVVNFQQPTRIIRNASTASAPGRLISNVNFNQSQTFVDARMDVQFLTPSLDIALPPKSVVSFLEYPRYISTGFGVVPANSTAPLQSQTITLPQIPDMLVIYVKPQNYGSLAGLNSQQVADLYLPITKISVNFDNYSGLLSSHQAYQLYQMSVSNGLRMDWNEWNGEGKVVNTTTGALSTATANNVALTGGFLVLKMGKDITLQAGQSPSVVGNYTLQFNCDVKNPTDKDITPNLFVMAVNSGFFETVSGSSRILKGVLTEQDVISAPPAPLGARSDLERLVGGGFLSKLGSALNQAKGLLMRPEVREVGKSLARSSGIKGLEQAANVADMVGLGQTGAGRTGGARRGGRRGMSALM